MEGSLTLQGMKAACSSDEFICENPDLTLENSWADDSHLQLK